MYKCKFCGKEFESKQKLAGHTIWCKSNPNASGKCNFHNGSGENHFKDYNAEKDDLYCKYCGKKCKSLNSLNNHERICPKNKDRIYISHTIGIEAWNKGLTKETDERLAKAASTYSKHYKEGLFKVFNPMKSNNADEYKLSISKKMKDNYEKNPWPTRGRSKHGWYKGIWCDSSYELAYVIYNLDHNIDFIRNTKGFDYIWEGESKKYYPDFYLINSNTYVEIKGYYDKKAQEKTKQFNGKLLLLQEKDLKYVFDYVYSKYGRDIWNLYDKHAPVV